MIKQAEAARLEQIALEGKRYHKTNKLTLDQIWWQRWVASQHETDRVMRHILLPPFALG